MSGKTVGSIFVITLLFGLLLSSGVEARRLNQASLSVDTNDGRQRGTIIVNGNDQTASSFSTGTRRASAAARVSTSPNGQTAQVGAVGDDEDGNIQGVGAGFSNERRPRSPASPTPSSTPQATVSVSGSGSASAGGTGTTSVTITGQKTTETEEEVKDMSEAPAPAPAPAVSDENIEDMAESSEEKIEKAPESKPEMMVEETVEAPVEEEADTVAVEASPAPEEQTVEESTEEQEESEVVSASVTISTESGKQEITVDGKSGPKVCLTSDTSMLEELLDEGYEVTILTPTRLGYEISMMRRSGYATSETSFILDHVPEDVQELCNYDPETAPIPAKHVQNQHNERQASSVLRNLCESKMVLYVPRLLDVCWDAGYLTYFDLAIVG